MELKSGEGTVVVADRDRGCKDGCCNTIQAWAPVGVQSVVHW